MDARSRTIRDKREKFWEGRSKKYGSLEWATKSGYLHAFLDAGDFNGDDIVLDIGTGTGIVAHTLAPHVKKVVGIDISQDMLDQAESHRVLNEEFIINDARDIGYSEGEFTKISARMVFHHIMEDTQKAMNECFRVLKGKGVMIFSEGVPPTDYVKTFYTEMFKLKEERITFTESDMLKLMASAGFKDIKKHIYWIRKASIKNWLENSGLAEDIQEKIFKMHVDMDERCRKDYNMTLSKDDCFIDMKFVTLAGKKC